MASSSPAISAAVTEITTAIRTLPPRPSIEEVAAALAVLRSNSEEEELRIAEIDRTPKPPDLPDELFSILKQVKKNCVYLTSFEQRKEAQAVVDLDNKFRIVDDLIQRASKVVSGGGGDGDGDEKDSGKDLESRSGKRIGSFGSFDAEEAKKASLDVQIDGNLVKESTGVANFASAKQKSQFGSGVPGDAEKLSLIKVASLIETSAKDKAGVLDLRGKLKDQIEWLPLSLGKLEDVIELNLSENKLMALPPTIGGLRSLMKLDLHSNQLVNLPESFGDLSNLVDLDLHANRLHSLPATFGNLINLVNLDLGSNQLSSLPDSLGNMTKLRRLNVETNDLEELPYTIGSCLSLTEIRLDFNQLKALPEAVGKLEQLEILTLHYNRVKGLPSTMGLLSHLKELDVSFNELETIPESLCFATSLIKLNVSNNFADLRALPKSIGNLEMLEELDISNDQIRSLPESFRFLTKLKVFSAEETPLEVPPRHIIKLGAQAVVNYMVELVSRKDVEGNQPAEKKKKNFWAWLFTLCSIFSKNQSHE